MQRLDGNRVTGRPHRQVPAIQLKVPNTIRKSTQRS